MDDKVIKKITVKYRFLIPHLDELFNIFCSSKIIF